MACVKTLTAFQHFFPRFNDSDKNWMKQKDFKFCRDHWKAFWGFKSIHLTQHDVLNHIWDISKSIFNPSPEAFLNLNIVLISNVFAILPALFSFSFLFRITEPNYSNEHNINGRRKKERTNFLWNLEMSTATRKTVKILF